MLRAEALRTESPKFEKIQVSALSVPVNQALWGIFMNSCVCATMHLTRNGDQLLTHCPELGGAEDSKGLRHGAGENQ